MKKISIVLAIHNEEGNIQAVIQSIQKAQKKIVHDMEVIAVNDGSTDKSLHQLAKASEKCGFIKIVDHPKKMGLTQVVVSALKQASGDIIMFFPSDMESHPDEDIPKLLNLIEKGYDVVAGRRINRKDGKIFTSLLGNLLICKLFGLKIHDINWIKAMTKQAADTMVLKYSWVRYMLLFPHFNGMKITEVETNWYPRKHGRSKYGVLRIVEALKDLLILGYFYSRGDFHNGTPNK